MKRVHYIFALILALVTIYFGAGVAFVHICSTYCHAQHHCSAHNQETGGWASLLTDTSSCAHSVPDAAPVKAEKLCCHIQSQSSCECLDITFQIDFFHQLSQQALLIIGQWVVDLPLQLAVPSQVELELFALSQAPHGPPVRDGRTLLALHSILII